MLRDKIRASIITATKNRQDVVKNILKVIAADVDIQEVRLSRSLQDEEVHGIIKKTLKGIDEMLGYKPDDVKFLMEKATLLEILPKTLSKQDILVALTDKIQEIKSAKNSGQATGIAIKFLKQQGLTVDGKEVGEVVNEMR